MNRHHARGMNRDDLMEMSASEPVPDNEEDNIEEAEPENKLTLGFQVFFLASFMTWIFICYEH